jgi:hypothetical protein
VQGVELRLGVLRGGGVAGVTRRDPPLFMISWTVPSASRVGCNLTDPLTAVIRREEIRRA